MFLKLAWECVSLLLNTPACEERKLELLEAARSRGGAVGIHVIRSP